MLQVQKLLQQLSTTPKLTNDVNKNEYRSKDICFGFVPKIVLELKLWRNVDEVGGFVGKKLFKYKKQTCFLKSYVTNKFILKVIK